MAMTDYLFGGRLTGRDGINYKIYFGYIPMNRGNTLRIQFAMDENGKVIPASAGMGENGADAVTWKNSLKARWAEFWDDTTNTWKEGKKGKGTFLRSESLLRYWLEICGDPRQTKQKETKQKKESDAIKGGKKEHHKGSKIQDGKYKKSDRDPESSARKGNHSMARMGSSRGAKTENASDAINKASKGSDPIPNDAYKSSLNSPSVVIGQFLQGKISVTGKKIADSPTIDVVESAFRDSGFQADRTGIVEATRELHRNPSLKSILNTVAWKDKPPMPMASIAPNPAIVKLLAGCKPEMIQTDDFLADRSVGQERERVKGGSKRKASHEMGFDESYTQNRIESSVQPLDPMMPQAKRVRSEQIEWKGPWLEGTREWEEQWYKQYRENSRS